jgi:hypothetical protein
LTLKAQRQTVADERKQTMSIVKTQEANNMSTLEQRRLVVPPKKKSLGFGSALKTVGHSALGDE